MSLVTESVIHLSDPETFKPDADGFFTARCVCGWALSPWPDMELAVDALMEHAYVKGQEST